MVGRIGNFLYRLGIILSVSILLLGLYLAIFFWPSSDRVPAYPGDRLGTGEMILPALGLILIFFAPLVFGTGWVTRYIIRGPKPISDASARDGKAARLGNVLFWLGIIVSMFHLITGIFVAVAWLWSGEKFDFEPEFEGPHEFFTYILIWTVVPFAIAWMVRYFSQKRIKRSA